MSAQLGDWSSTGLLRSNLSLPLMELARYDDSMHELDAAEQIFRSLSDRRGEIANIHKQVRLFGFKMKQFDYALNLARNALELSCQGGFQDLQERTRLLIAELERRAATFQ